ncbi:MAG: Mrp/NBP35 family ATP-binding protein [Albidovulum sp.]|nr:Mrp/NBP35 family ATP-binding protein [Albidovulum sp.]MDE0533120.1 Mrp/NBP35 family ATP-binding protein [Albidovulum sp.]
MSPTRDDALAALKEIVEPESGQNIVAAGLLRALTVDGADVRFVLDVSPSRVEGMEVVRADAEAAIKALPGVEKVTAVMTAHSTAPPPPPPDLRSNVRAEPKGPRKIPGIRKIVAIASGKGGVGKSTVAANLAAALAAEGQRTGLLDGDVYGPSQPRMLGVTGRPASPDGKTILPMRNHGVTMMSMGLLTAEDEAVVWRGPMLMGALQQMLNQVQWGALDLLLVDLPPGTGDVQMTLCQHAEVAGAIIVCTPQDVALLDARKGIGMFRKMNVPIIGMIENMSKHICAQCGHEEHVFDHGGVAAEAKKFDVPLLAEIPLQLSIRQASDQGAPIVVSQPNSPAAEAFRRVARELVAGAEA